MQESQTSLYGPVKPCLTESQASSLCTKLYAIKPTRIVQFPGYDDQNFWIQKPLAAGKNKFMDNILTDGYVLKITNAKESEDLGLIEAQVKVLLQLGENKIPAPLPVPNVNGEYYSLEMFQGKDKICRKHAVRLLTYVKGDVLLNAQVTPKLAENLGSFLNKLDSCIKNFKHEAFIKREQLFMLSETPKLKNFLHVVKDNARKAMVMTTVERIESEVLPAIDRLEKGLIHGDFNEQNVLVNGDNVAAILDFGDCHCAPYIFEVAIAIAYLLMLTQDFSICQRFLEGYSKERKFTQLEEDILMVCIRARICQSVVLGLYAFTENPENNYVLSSQKTGWEMLTILMTKPDRFFTLGSDPNK